MADVKSHLNSFANLDVISRVNAASSLRGVMRIISREAAFGELMSELRKDNQAVVRLLDSIEETVRRPVDERFESPYDIQCAAALLAVATERIEFTSMAIAIISQGVNLWWAKHLARRIENAGGQLVNFASPEVSNFRDVVFRKSVEGRVRTWSLTAAVVVAWSMVSVSYVSIDPDVSSESGTLMVSTGFENGRQTIRNETPAGTLLVDKVIG